MAKSGSNNHRKTLSRRNFLASTAAFAGVTVLPRYVLGGSGYASPSEKLNVACIGVGNQGTYDMKAILPIADTQVIAICDVAERTESRWSGRDADGRKPAIKTVVDTYSENEKTRDYKPPVEYVDFRDMFEKEKNIDAVIVATPDHTHAIATMAAIKHGKHVYCEKPLTHTIPEARKIAAAAKEAGVTTQMGNQGHSGEGIRLTVEWIKAGAIGDVRQVYSWSRNEGRYDRISPNRPEDTPPVPDGLDWDLWIGPRPKRPYHPYYHPGLWRAWWDFGNSTLGDMACHNMDPAFWALDLGHPDTVEATSTRFNEETAPIAAMYTYKFPERGTMPPVTLTWYTGGIMPPLPDELEEGRELDGRGNGILFIGDKGKIMCAGWAGTPQLIPASKMKDFDRPPKTLPRTSGDHMRDWVDACKKGVKSCADFEYSAHLTEVVLLGNVALRAGEKLRWDGENMKATNCPDADKFIHQGYYNGWTL